MKQKITRPRTSSEDGSTCLQMYIKLKPDTAYVIRFNGSKTSKNNRVYHNVEVLGCEEDLFVQDAEEELPAS